ncbi:unnamed protein product [Closterium sp. Naga37s-1]|nr:unnamed protein product [Closterium sp. Naga37s-1]
MGHVRPAVHFLPPPPPYSPPPLPPLFLLPWPLTLPPGGSLCDFFLPARSLPPHVLPSSLLILSPLCDSFTTRSLSISVFPFLLALSPPFCVLPSSLPVLPPPPPPPAMLRLLLHCLFSKPPGASFLPGFFPPVFLSSLPIPTTPLLCPPSPLPPPSRASSLPAHSLPSPVLLFPHPFSLPHSRFPSSCPFTLSISVSFIPACHLPLLCFLLPCHSRSHQAYCPSKIGCMPPGVKCNGHLSPNLRFPLSCPFPFPLSNFFTPARTHPHQAYCLSNIGCMPPGGKCNDVAYCPSKIGCMPPGGECNGVADCADGSDEGPQCPGYQGGSSGSGTSTNSTAPSTNGGGSSDTSTNGTALGGGFGGEGGSMTGGGSGTLLY